MTVLPARPIAADRRLEAVRAPMMGAPIAPHTYSFLAIMALVGWSIVFSLFAVTRRRIVHYL